MPSLTVENYLKAIYLIASDQPEGEAVSTGEIAQALNVTPGTVTGMLKTLSEAEFSTYTPYEGARLTSSGRGLALKVLASPPLARTFPRPDSPDDLGRGPRGSRAHGARGTSDRLIDRIDTYLGQPAVDPHGDPIPRPDGSLTETTGLPLAQLAPGQRFRVVRVVDQDPAFLRYLTECGLDLGCGGGYRRESAGGGDPRVQSPGPQRRPRLRRGRQAARQASARDRRLINGGCWTARCRAGCRRRW